MTSHEQQELSLALAQLKLKFSPGPAVLDKLERYLDLLEKWNKTINLTAVRKRSEMIARHLLDSLSCLEWVKLLPNLVDVGSGAGFPGIPLALMVPGMAVTLVEANQKKAAFLRQVKLELELSQVSVVEQRVENWNGSQPFAGVITRAFSDLVTIVQLTEQLVDQNGVWLALKGVIPYEEIGRLPNSIQAEVVPLRVPGLLAQRHLVIMRRVNQRS